MKKSLLLFALCLVGALSLPVGVQAASNTVVRFRFTFNSAVFGDVEVELFDQDKPVTVSNFLHYVRSGQYKNTFIHRVSPAHPTAGGFPVIIQGGGFRAVNPFSTKVLNNCGYEEIAPTNSTASITNESNFGPIYTNGPGTLAMATQSGDPDSARASWFFNLVNNPDFNPGSSTNNGGYAVFGRVLKDPKKVLNYFRTVSWCDGVIYLPYSSFYCGEVASFTELPIALRGGCYCPISALLFVVDITELNSTNRADTSRPTITLTAPTSNQRISNEIFTVTGKAADKGMGLSEVRVYPSPCDALVALGTTNWSLSLTGVPPGTNVIEVESFDAAGNRSAVTRRTFFRVLTTPVTVVTNGTGSGKVSGLTDSQPIEIGRDYVITAKADKGSLFAGWRASRVTYTATNSTTNTISSDSPSIRLRAESNLTFTATFVANPFLALKGTYVGLFYNTNSFLLRHDYSGAVKFTLTDQGKFTGSATFGSKAYPFSGTFHPSRGTASIRFKGPGGAYIVMDPVQITLTNELVIINGVISDNASWGSYINAHRVHAGTTANPSPYKGSYTWMVPGEANPPGTPAGDSFGRFTVSKTGTLDFTGTMADGTPVSAGTTISTNGLWPLRSHFNNGTGSILSWVSVDTSRTNDDLFGTFYWFQNAPGWTYASYTGTIQTNGTNFLLFLNARGDLYIDDLKLVVGTDLQSGSNLLVNAGFEDPLPGTWAGLGNHASSTDVTSYAHSGSKSLRILASSKGGTSAAVRQILPPFPSNTVCTVGFYYLPSPSGTELTIRTTPGSKFLRTYNVGSSLTTLLRKKFYPDGFTITNDLTGSRYVAPVGTTNRVLTNFVSSGAVALMDGNLSGPQTNVVALLPNNTVANQSTNKLTFMLTKTTGLFSGTVAPTNQAKSITYKGAILQKQGYGAGFHLDTNRSGRAYFGP